MRRPAGAVSLAVAAAAAVGLVVVYLALGGASYEPAGVADPCASRAWREPSGTAESIEQVVLSTADGTACSLGASREELILALRSGDSLSAFAREHGISDDEVEEAVRAGLLRAVDDAEQADAIDAAVAGLLRGAAERLPISLVLDLIRGASSLLP
ncbi:MAG TPA: hypothetical protein VH950_16500 [Gaiellaceae bacterium]